MNPNDTQSRAEHHEKEKWEPMRLTMVGNLASVMLTKTKTGLDGGTGSSSHEK
jgi:hypothetical protein